MSGNSNNNPVANSDTVATSEDARLVISAAQLLANDTDRNNDRLRITSVGGGSNCSVSIDCNGNIVVDPKANFSGTASFFSLAGFLCAASFFGKACGFLALAFGLRS